MAPVFLFMVFIVCVVSQTPTSGSNATLADTEPSIDGESLNVLSSSANSTTFFANESNTSPSSSTTTAPRVVLYRIIGNNVPFLQGAIQNIRNTEYIVNNEIDFPGVTKRFILNRILNATIESQILSILRTKFPASDILRIPFLPEEFRVVYERGKTAPKKSCYINWKPRNARRKGFKLAMSHFRTKDVPKRILRGPISHISSAYIASINFARNFALQDATAGQFDCFYPFDGNVFVPKDTIPRLVDTCWKATPGRAIMIFMTRTIQREGDRYLTMAEPQSEYQMGFRAPFEYRFNESECHDYGHGDKVELMLRACPVSRKCITIRRRVWRLPHWVGPLESFLVSDLNTRGALRYFGIQKLIDYAIWLSGIEDQWAQPPFHPPIF